MVAATLIRLDAARARRALERVVDPEIPVLNVLEMGVVRDIEAEGERVEVAITPTYSGCPAMHAIALDIDRALTDQLNAVMHAPDFQKLEAAWRGLHYLVQQSETSTTLKIRVLNVSKSELVKDL